MRRNAGPRAMPPDQVLAVMTAAADALCARMPGERRETVERTVYEVTAELISTVTDPERLAAMLRLRATARLSAAAGEPVAVRSRTRPARRESASR